MRARTMAIWLLVYAVAAVAAMVLTVLLGDAHAQVPPPEAARYRAGLTSAAHSQWGLGAPVAALAAQVHQESGWNPQAVSHVGAAGLAQFMPQTAKWWCQREGITPAQCLPTNPTWALRALVGYDKYLFDRAPQRFDERDRLWVALRAYNGGLGHWLAEARNAPGWATDTHTREGVDAACGTARRHPVHCRENLGYPKMILWVLQPRYATWGPATAGPARPKNGPPWPMGLQS